MSRRPANTSQRPIGLPRLIEVRVGADGLPLTVIRTAVRGRSGAEVPVEHIEEVWRVAEAWWREASHARTYYRVMLVGGQPLSIFRDDILGVWAEQPY